MVNASKTWDTLDEDTKLGHLNHALDLQIAQFKGPDGTPMPRPTIQILESKKKTTPKTTTSDTEVEEVEEEGAYNHGPPPIIKIYKHADGGSLKMNESLDVALDECTHSYQNFLVDLLKNGKLKEDDPRYEGTKVFQLNFGDYANTDDESEYAAYKDQPVEHAWRSGNEAKLAFKWSKIKLQIDKKKAELLRYRPGLASELEKLTAGIGDSKNVDVPGAAKVLEALNVMKTQQEDAVKEYILAYKRFEIPQLEVNDLLDKLLKRPLGGTLYDERSKLLKDYNALIDKSNDKTLSIAGLELLTTEMGSLKTGCNEFQTKLDKMSKISQDYTRVKNDAKTYLDVPKERGRVRQDVYPSYAALLNARNAAAKETAEELTEQVKQLRELLATYKMVAGF